LALVVIRHRWGSGSERTRQCCVDHGADHVVL
jgi:hypothetical protein